MSDLRDTCRPFVERCSHASRKTDPGIVGPAFKGSGRSWSVFAGHFDFAPSRAFNYLDPYRHCVGHIGDVCDHSDQATVGAEAAYGGHDYVERLCIQASKTLVKEQT